MHVSLQGLPPFRESSARTLPATRIVDYVLWFHDGAFCDGTDLTCAVLQAGVSSRQEGAGSLDQKVRVQDGWTQNNDLRRFPHR